MMGISLLSLNREREEKRKVQDETTWEMLRTISTEAGQMKVLDRIMDSIEESREEEKQRQSYSNKYFNKTQGINIDEHKLEEPNH